jgi:hypothetical protein
MRSRLPLWLACLSTALFALSAIAADEPPARVGRISLVQGDVYVQDTSSEDAFYAESEWPVAQGSAFEVLRGSRMEVRIGSSTVRMAADTRASFEALDEDIMRIRLDTGNIALRLVSEGQARETVIATDLGSVSFLQAGSYRIDFDGYGQSAITVLSGRARLDAPGMSVVVNSGRRLEWQANGASRYTSVYNDAFASWVSDRDRADERRPAPRYVSAEMTGWEALDEHGTWVETPTYGTVWLPQNVTVDWAPYRAGRWVWLSPWGWTWVDNAPWGFAVSHYGRWASINGRWCWVPGTVSPRPVWAPALVAFAGGSGWSVSVQSGGPRVGWVPLAPNEVFVPWYNAAPRYWTAVNRSNVRDVTVIHNYTDPNRRQNYANSTVPGAVTAAPAGSAFARGAVGGPPVRQNRPTAYQAVTNPAAAREAFETHRITAPPRAVDAPIGPLAPRPGPMTGNPPVSRGQNPVTQPPATPNAAGPAGNLNAPVGGNPRSPLAVPSAPAASPTAPAAEPARRPPVAAESNPNPRAGERNNRAERVDPQAVRPAPVEAERAPRTAERPVERANERAVERPADRQSERASERAAPRVERGETPRQTPVVATPPPVAPAPATGTAAEPARSAADRAAKDAAQAERAAKRAETDQARAAREAREASDAKSAKTPDGSPRDRKREDAGGGGRNPRDN